MKQDTTMPTQTTHNSKKRWIIRAGIALVAAVFLAGGVYGYLYASTPAHIRRPSYEHYHLRTQIIADSIAVDFSTGEFQKDYDASSCSADLPEFPIDFHDYEDQMTHVHWSGITGGELLKYYGWNLIGGEDSSLGRRYDQGLKSISHVKTAGNLLPNIPKDSNFYVYIGDDDAHVKKDWDDFINMDLEDFFETKSTLNTSFNILDLFTDQAYAHGGAVEETTSPTPADETEEARLTRINNLIGNVVIFAQANEPTDEEIQKRFDNLVPLHDSACGG